MAAEPWWAARLLLVPAVLAAGLWWWHRLRQAVAGPRTTLWHAAVILVPIFGGLLLLVVSSAAILEAVLQWLVGVRESPLGAQHFAFIPEALSAELVGAWAWGYHRAVLVSDPERRPHGARARLTLWWLFWRRLAHPEHLDGSSERLSPSRRAYPFLLFGGAGLAAVVSLIVILFTVLRELFEGTVSTAVVADVRTAGALLVTAGGVSAYHWTVYGEDRAERGAAEPAPERFVLLVAPDPAPLRDRLEQDTNATVQALRRLDAAAAQSATETAPGTDADAVIQAVLSCSHARMLVVVAVHVVPYAPLRP